MFKLVKSRRGILGVFLVVGFLVGQEAFSQIKIRGTVFDISKQRPLEGVSVMSTSGSGTVTDVLGNYVIKVGMEDSIYFSYLEKPTSKFPVRQMIATNNFDISLHVASNILPEIFVKPRSYKEDSIQNRLDYAKAFDFRRPGVSTSMLPPGAGGPGVGVDLAELVNVFRFRRNKNMLAFQERVEQQEKDKYVDRRFSKGIVKKVTGLDGDDLTMFMKMYRPTYEFTTAANDYEFFESIKQNSAKFRAVFLPSEK
ncbi:MAG: hypothetical protein H7Y03_13905 [Chitinophagaceae bacterium]|nr:hypothetical protein [Chitinophagaceae bacterium]